VLVDACYSGKGGFAAAKDWVTDLQGTLRFDMLTAAADRPAANGCFSLTLARLMREGVEAEPAEHLLALHLRPLIADLCPNQVPQQPSWMIDKTLWLSRNAGRILEPWAQTALADEIQRLTLAYQPTPALGEIVERSRKERCVAVVGEAGAGKSAQAAALSWPKVADGIVPARFVQAIALIDEATTPHELSRTLTHQLARVPGFPKVQKAFKDKTPLAEHQRLGILEKELIGPLKRLPPATKIRLVVDALDRLATGARGPVMAALEELAELSFMRLVVTARPDTEVPKRASVYSLARAPDANVSQYLARREIPEARWAEITNSAEGSWLVVRVLADLLRDRPDAEIRGAGQLALGDAYEELLARCGAARGEAISGTLELLAAAGAGPLLPLSLLCKASEVLGGPALHSRVSATIWCGCAASPCAALRARSGSRRVFFIRRSPAMLSLARRTKTSPRTRRSLPALRRLLPLAPGRRI
jgi:hypothetical protein